MFIFTSSLKSLGLPSNLSQPSHRHHDSVTVWPTECPSLGETGCEREKVWWESIMEWQGKMTERVPVTHNLSQCEKASLRDTMYWRKWVWHTCQSVCDRQWSWPWEAAAWEGGSILGAHVSLRAAIPRSPPVQRKTATWLGSAPQATFCPISFLSNKTDIYFLIN